MAIEIYKDEHTFRALPKPAPIGSSFSAPAERHESNKDASNRRTPRHDAGRQTAVPSKLAIRRSKKR